MYTRIRICLRGVAVLLAAVVIAALTALLCGCSDGGSIAFDRDGITLFVGESRDVFPYVRFAPSTAADKTVTVTTDGECVTVDGTAVHAVECGECSIKVQGSGGEAEMRVTVVYRAAQSLRVEVVGKLDQSVASVKDIQPIEFVANTDGYADPELVADWSVDGVATSQGNAFTYAPTGYGEYEVTATVAGLSARKTVHVYVPTQTKVTCYGELTQHGEFTAVKYTAEQKIDPDNPRSVYEWKINGKNAGSSPVFEFTPSKSGSYVVSLAVNGAEVKLPEDIDTITASGERVPSCAVAFDDEKGVYIQWHDCDVFRISIVSPDGSRRDVDRTDAQYSYLFDTDRFDASDYIDVCAQDPGEYKISVHAESKSELTFKQYPLEAAEYLSEKPFYKNLFVSGDEDGCALIDDVYSSGLTEISFYTAYDAQSAPEAMRSYAQSLGLSVSAVESGHAAKFCFAPYKNAPEKFDPLPDVTRMYTELPHIEYDGSKRRTTPYVFAIDRAKKSVAVKGSEQLVTAVARGLRPEPQKGSAAEAIYSTVRSRLLSIVGAGYTAAQKVHAIYDWLQWVTVSVPTADRANASNYVESVFGMLTLPGGDARRAAVTSEGAAKTFALMCGVEGIECIIQAAVVDGNTYMTNKVKIDGLWYNIDVLGGKATSAEVGVQRAVELCTHRALLIDDQSAKELGLFPAGGEYRAFDSELRSYYDKTKTGGEYSDKYVSVVDNANYEKVKEVVFGAFSRCALGSVSVPVLAGIETYRNTTLGVEIEIAVDTESGVQKVRELLVSAANEYAKSVFGTSFAQSAVRIYHINNTIHLVASTAGMSALDTNK